MMVSAAARPVPDAAGAVEPGSDYFATEAHYLSVAGRIVTALRDGSLVLVAGDPSGDSDPLCEALDTIAPSHRTVIKVPWGPGPAADLLAQAGPAVAAPAAGSGPADSPKTPERAAPLFVFGEAERFSEQQLEEICETVQRGAWKGAAGVLLGRQSILARLEDPSLRFLKAALAGQVRFDEIGQDEGVDFLRHQMANRQPPDTARSISPGLIRALGALVVLTTIGIAALVTVRYFPTAGTPPSAPNPTTTESAPPGAAPAAFQPPPPQAMSETAKPAPSQPTQTPPPASPPSAAQSPADQGLSSAEITALLARGDRFLSTGDIASARLFYERAANAGVGAAALRLGATFDPGFLSRAGVRGAPGDPAQAAAWYRRARELGEVAAGERLNDLAQPPATGADSSAR
jgi:hypothetical protein